jgi:rhodanese-related sulfurtransferase
VPASEINTATMPTLDARAHPGREQIRGAVRYDPKDLLREDPLLLPMAHDEHIVVYSDNEERATHIAERLQEQGYENAAILAGGFEAYREAGLPVEGITQLQPIPGTDSGIHDL